MINIDDFLEEDGTYKQRPETKTRADLERVIALGKSKQVIEKFAELVALGEYWDWFELNKDGIENFDEESEEIIERVLQTVDSVLSRYYSQRRKNAYPELSEFADAFVKSKNGKGKELDEYIKKCKQVKIDIPKA